MGNKICVIAPYADLAELACAVGRETPIPFDVWEGNLEIGGAKAQRRKKKARR